MFELKEYQKDCVAALTRYLKRCNDVGPKVAFVEQAEHPYNAVSIRTERRWTRRSNPCQSWN